MTRDSLLVLSITGAMMVLSGTGPAAAADSTALRARFAAPPREYSSAPLWVWNDMLSAEQVRGSLRDLAGQNVKQAFVHPRPGLMTPYLSADWFRLWKVALDEAQRLDMNVWIYDEDSYPSGFAGGLVPAAMPEARGRGLFFTAVPRPGKPGGDVLAVFRCGNGGCEEVTARARAGEPLPDGQYLVAAVRRGKFGAAIAFVFQPGEHSNWMLWAEKARQCGAVEFHVHLLAANAEERDFAVRDLAPAQKRAA